MAQPNQPTHDPGTRLGRFRALMARLTAAGDPRRALDGDLYVAPPGGLGSRVAGQLELRPSSTHLLVGGVGSGKTTELLEAQRRLSGMSDTTAHYVDVSRNQDISKLAPGVVLVQAALAIAEARPEMTAAKLSGETAAKELRELAHGYWFEPEPPSWDGDMLHHAGLLTPPERLEKNAASAQAALSSLLDAVRPCTEHIVVLLDGLDRLTDVTAFEQVVDHDVRALSSLGIGVVLVGPLKCLYRGERAIAQRFDDFHHQPWRDPRNDPAANEFLARVVRRRLAVDALDDPGLGALVLDCGGVLRDLVAIAQLSCEEAYLDGADVISVFEVDIAADAFGRKHMIGLQADEIEALQRVLTSGVFVQSSDEDLALLMTRRVLEYATDGRARYAVHPTIEPLLRQLAAEKP